MTDLQLAFAALLLLTCAFAYLRGGTPERIVASVFAVGAVASRLVEESRLAPFQTLELGILHIDLAMLLILTWLALFSSRFWPMMMASLQGTQVLGHVADLLDVGTLPKAYYALAVFWAFPMLALLVIGTLRHGQRVKLYGRDYSWSSQLPRTYRDGVESGEAPQT